MQSDAPEEKGGRGEGGGGGEGSGEGGGGDAGRAHRDAAEPSESEKGSRRTDGPDRRKTSGGPGAAEEDEGTESKHSSRTKVGEEEADGEVGQRDEEEDEEGGEEEQEDLHTVLTRMMAVMTMMTTVVMVVMS